MNSEDESQRPWGRYEILQESAIHKTKCIYVLPGKRLSYQRHQKRAEHWFIIQGDAEVTLEGKVSKLSSGDTISIAKGKSVVWAKLDRKSCLLEIILNLGQKLENR